MVGGRGWRGGVVVSVLALVGAWSPDALAVPDCAAGKPADTCTQDYVGTAAKPARYQLIRRVTVYKVDWQGSRKIPRECLTWPRCKCPGGAKLVQHPRYKSDARHQNLQCVASGDPILTCETDLGLADGKINVPRPQLKLGPRLTCKCPSGYEAAPITGSTRLVRVQESTKRWLSSKQNDWLRRAGMTTVELFFCRPKPVPECELKRNELFTNAYWKGMCSCSSDAKAITFAGFQVCVATKGLAARVRNILIDKLTDKVKEALKGQLERFIGDCQTPFKTTLLSSPPGGGPMAAVRNFKSCVLAKFKREEAQVARKMEEAAASDPQQPPATRQRIKKKLGTGGAANTPAGAGGRGAQGTAGAGSGATKLTGAARQRATKRLDQTKRQYDDLRRQRARYRRSAADWTRYLGLLHQLLTVMNVARASLGLAKVRDRDLDAGAAGGPGGGRTTTSGGARSGACKAGQTFYRAKNGKGFCCPTGTKGYYAGASGISCRRVGGNTPRSSGCKPGSKLFRAKNGKGFCCPTNTLGFYQGTTGIACRRLCNKGQWLSKRHIDGCACPPGTQRRKRSKRHKRRYRCL